MENIKTIILILMSLFLLSCEKVRQGLGIEKKAPDEFLVERKNIITLPPNYNLIEPDTKKNFGTIDNSQDLKKILSKEIKNKTNLNSPNNLKNADFPESIENQFLNKIK